MRKLGYIQNGEENDGNDEFTFIGIEDETIALGLGMHTEARHDPTMHVESLLHKEDITN